jgi:hypothetical protein
MKPTNIFFALPVILAAMFTACKKQESAQTTADMTLKQKIARFAPTEISADISKLSPGDKKTLDKIIEAARLMDLVYFRQVWRGNVELIKKLETDTTSAGQERLHYFRINMGPWSLLDNNEPFIDSAPKEKPVGANYYPDDMTKEEFNKWIATLTEKEREKATGFFYTIRRDLHGKLKTVPYCEEYKEWLEPAAKLLKEAAKLTENKTLSKYLTKRAEAFASNDYYASDVAWIELDSPIDLTIGPYETYMDELFGYKAAFEAYVTLRDKAESAKLAKFSAYLQEIENNLPMEAKYRNPKLASRSPICVVDVVYAAGDGNHGIQTAAFNLPNDERVTRDKGFKQVLLKNMQEAKFNKILIPISKSVLDPSQQSNVSFDAFFTHILMHELVHGLGPHDIFIGKSATTVRKELKELYSPIEEAKADITGLFALQFLIDKGLIDKTMENHMYITFLASMFRSARFGINEAHGKGVAIQFNYLTQEGGIKIDDVANTFSVDMSRIKEVVKNLAGEILTLEAEGSYKKAKGMIDRYAIIHPAMQRALDKLVGTVPVDIEPIFTLVPKVEGSIR